MFKVIFALALTAVAHGQLAVKADLLFTMTGDLKPIKNGIVLCGEKGKIRAVGPASQVKIPKGYKTLTAKVVTPGIIDAHSTVGLSGILNSPKHDQEQLENSSPMQPELRAVDAYNGRDPLVKWLRDLGVTTVHTGHAPGTLMSGQLMVVKTNVPSITSIKDTLVPTSAVASTLGSKALSKSPGTRSKAIAMLRAELMKGQSRRLKIEEAKADKEKDAPAPNLRLDVLVDILNKKTPLLVNAQRHQDIAAALRLQEEFGFDLILDGAAEAYLLLEEIKAAGVPVMVHPTMGRPYGDLENMTFTLAAKLHKADIPFAFSPVTRLMFRRPAWFTLKQRWPRPMVFPRKWRLPPALFSQLRFWAWTRKSDPSKKGSMPTSRSLMAIHSKRLPTPPMLLLMEKSFRLLRSKDCFRK
jgi:imidazolonepropionase-like amidohydrolase